MKVDVLDFYRLGMCLAGFLFGTVSVLQLFTSSPNCLKLTPPPSPGLYSGIFAIYLQCRVSSHKDTDSRQNILFYALSLLYVLSLVIIALDITGIAFKVIQNVDSYLSSKVIFCPKNQFLQNTTTNVYYLDIMHSTIAACCDFMAQSILVRHQLITLYPFT